MSCATQFPLANTGILSVTNIYQITSAQYICTIYTLTSKLIYCISLYMSANIAVKFNIYT